MLSCFDSGGPVGLPMRLLLWALSLLLLASAVGSWLVDLLGEPFHHFLEQDLFKLSVEEAILVFSFVVVRIEAYSVLGVQ